jgi:hypothetical protein
MKFVSFYVAAGREKDTKWWNNKGTKNVAIGMSFVRTAQKRGMSAFLAITDALLNKPYSVNVAVVAE